MRFLILLSLIIAGCGDQAPRADGTPTLKVGHYFEQGARRGRFCVHPGEGPQRATFITFARKGDTNCSASGTIRVEGQAMLFVPKGETECRIPLELQGDQLTLRPAPAACAYYCGPGVELGGQAFRWADTSTAKVIAEPLLPDNAAC